MAAPVLDPSTFFAALSKAGLLSDQQITAARRVCQGLSDPSVIARKLVNASRLSPWQANQILRGREDYCLGNYTLLDQVTVDDAGEMYLARHTSLGRRATIRVFGLSRPFTAEGSRQFLHKAQRIAALDHPNVVHVYDVDQVDDHYCLIMEDVSGANLHKQVTPNNALVATVAAEYVCQAAAGLAYAHRSDVVHGNLTPKQLIRVGDTIKIIDFALPDLASCTSMDGSAVVDADFVAPEKALAASQADARSDIYSLGCTLFYLLVGRPPFHEGTRADRLRAHCEQEPPAIGDLRTNVPAALIGICQQMMAKNLAARYASAKQIVDALSQFLAAQKPAPAAAPAPARRAEVVRRAKPLPGPPAHTKPAQSPARATAVGTEFPGVVVPTPGQTAGDTARRPGRSKQSDQTFTILAAGLILVGLIIAGGLFFFAGMDREADEAVSGPASDSVFLPDPVSRDHDRARPSARQPDSGTASHSRPPQDSQPTDSTDGADSDFPEPGAYSGTAHAIGPDEQPPEPKNKPAKNTK